MKYLDGKGIRKLMLIVESFLIIICILLGRGGEISMFCYWLLTAVYHAEEILDMKSGGKNG